MYEFGTHRARGAESRQAGGGEPPAFRAAAAQIERAERQIDLLGRVRPLDGAGQVARWLAARERGERAALVLDYAPAPDLGALRRALERLNHTLEHEGPIAGLYAARVRELALDAELAESVGAPAFASLARRRHAERTGEDWVAARGFANAWVSSLPVPQDDSATRSDDARASTSLLSILRREIGRLRLPLRVEPSATLATRAATADGVIYVRSGILLARRAAERIALHELQGHALPRLSARAQLVGLFRVGSAGSGEDEEGRAVRLEQRAGLLDDARCRELGARHLAALAVAEGADAHECARRLEATGCSPQDAIAYYVRAARGGGLCREMEYLPAWCRVSAALASDPDLDRWLARGRLGLHAAAVLRNEGVALIEA